MSIRNPFHNFTHYTIGWAGKPYTVWTSKPNTIDSGFADGNGWLRAILTLDKKHRYYVSYQNRWSFYLGWHPGKGAFGIRLTRRVK